MSYQYSSINEIDYHTLDYLKFVIPKPLEEMSISEINEFLNTLEKYFIEQDALVREHA